MLPACQGTLDFASAERADADILDEVKKRQRAPGRDGKVCARKRRVGGRSL